MDRLIDLLPDLWDATFETLFVVSFALILGGVLGLLLEKCRPRHAHLLSQISTTHLLDKREHAAPRLHAPRSDVADRRELRALAHGELREGFHDRVGLASDGGLEPHEIARGGRFRVEVIQYRQRGERRPCPSGDRSSWSSS